ncbi:MAG: bifunctional metallophosphatase/5'-nucleotidase [Gemmatimonadetes bacterium]|nr:bifunctional metallophosphatase/5'-nucleotidase [Gemmatimonadota bacterium]
MRRDEYEIRRDRVKAGDRLVSWSAGAETTLSLQPMVHALVAAAVIGMPADSILLRVLTVNDFHGALEPRTYSWSQGRPVGGIAALKAWMDSLEADCRCETLRLDAGDQMQGTLGSNLVHGRSTVEALNLLGLDAAAIGNHDLDWGVDTLVTRLSEAGYQWLAANVIDSATGRRPGWAKPWAMVAAGPWRVAVIGYLTPQTKTIVMDRHVRGLHFRGGRAAFADALSEIAAAAPDLTMIVAHEGAYCDSSCRGEIVGLARELDSTEVDLIVAGHTHSRIATTVRGIPVISARENGNSVGIADLVVAADGSRRWRLGVANVYADVLRPDSAALALVARYRPRVDSLSRVVIAQIGDSLLTSGSEYPLGNLIADAQRRVTRADVALMNNGGIRRALLPGPATYGDLFELHPFGNNVVSLAVSGALLREVLEHTLSGGRPDAHISGATVRYDPRRPKGDRIRSIRLRDGRRVTPNGRYTLGISDFLAGGGGGYAMLRPVRQRPSNVVDLDATIAWLRRLPQPVRARAERRWIPVTTP